MTQAHAQVAESLEQQTATSEILRVISQSPTDVQPVFNTIVESVVQLCDGVSATVYRFDGHLIHLVAHHHSVPSAVREVFERVYPLPPSRTSVVAQAILDRSLVHVRDFENDPAIPTASREMARAVGHRSLVAVPMLRGEEPIGAISVGRRGPHGEVRPFTDSEIALLQTFADQAVIAIENVRLFNETKEALERQTASSEILCVISSSPTDIQPVFDAVVENAALLCEANDVAIYRREGDRLRFVAHQGSIPPPGRVGEYVRPLERGSVTGRSVLEARLLHLADVQTKADEFPTASDLAQRLGFRTLLSVPLIREGTAIGTIMVRRTEARLFTERQVALLKTFADQAVIAIENVRLFTELQKKNQALTKAHAQVSESLEQQTATSEILRVISSSPTDLQPVFETVCCSRAHWDKEFGTGRAILDRAIVHVPDTERDTERNRELARDFGYRRLLVVPMMRGDEAIGALAVTGREPGSFSPERMVALFTSTTRRSRSFRCERAVQVRAGHQHEDCEDVGPDHPANGLATGGPGDRLRSTNAASSPPGWSTRRRARPSCPPMPA